MIHPKTHHQSMRVQRSGHHTTQGAGAHSDAPHTTPQDTPQPLPDLPQVALLLARLAVRRYLTDKEKTND